MHTMNYSIQDVMSNKLYHEISAGGVVVNTINGEPRFVVIDRASIRDTSLPKGHQETGESLQQTAIREVLEETGYHAEPVKYLGEFTYEAKNSNEKKTTFITVHWFLMMVISGEPIAANNEIQQVRLLPFDADLSVLNYENHREFVLMAKKELCKHLSSK